MNRAFKTYKVTDGSRRRADAFVTGSGGKFKVHSPAIVDGKQKTFAFANLTQDVAIVTLPDAVAGKTPTVVLPRGVAVFKLVSGAVGDYDYSVVMRTGSGRLATAHGNSDPVIIIDPPCP